jgi:hypothetical protein
MGFLGWVLWVFQVFHWMWCWAAGSLAKERGSRGRGGGAMMLFAGACPSRSSPQLARAGPPRPCLGLATPTRPTPFSRPTPAEERENRGRQSSHSPNPRWRKREKIMVRQSSPAPVLTAPALILTAPAPVLAACLGLSRPQRGSG